MLIIGPILFLVNGDLHGSSVQKKSIDANALIEPNFKLKLDPKSDFYQPLDVDRNSVAPLGVLVSQCVRFRFDVF
ncbi:MAG TPA: hypothetical protein V6C69_09825, partial [Trichormus sp.]